MKQQMILKAFEGALTNTVVQLNLTVWSVVAEGNINEVEVATNYVAKDGSEREFSQVFVVEGSGESITRWQTYLPFSPE